MTVRHLLGHRGGWDEDNGPNPLGGSGFIPNSWPTYIRRDLGQETAPTPLDLVRWMMGKPLQFSPGTTFSYADFGYDVAGVLMARMSGQAYEAVVRRLLAGAGITRMRVGTNTRSERAPGEAVYYLHPSLPASYLEAFEPLPWNDDLPYALPVTLYSSWIASTIDFARFVAAVDGQSSYPDILGTNSVAAMLNGRLGWEAGSNPGAGQWFHGGGDTGNHSVAMRRSNGAIIVYLQNPNWPGNNGVIDAPPGILAGIRQWPTHDLFPTTLSREAWRARQFSIAELSDPDVSADTADPDGDGLANLLEYAQGTDPRVASPAAPLTISRQDRRGGGFFAVGYRRLALAHEVEYSLEMSTDLVGWARVDNDEGESTVDADGTVSATVMVWPPDHSSGQFFRLRIVPRPLP